MSLFDLSGRHAVVVAATSTLGSAMAEGLAAHGARVAVVGREAEKTEGVRRRVAAVGGEAAGFCADPTSLDDLARLLDEVTAWGGNVHVAPRRSSTSRWRSGTASWT
jgi:NAD(P)-dependent dehydrogenase (short-subunit alcohol dehydrogenase family)